VVVLTGAGSSRSVSEEEERVVAGREMAEGPAGRDRRDQQGTEQKDQEDWPRVTPPLLTYSLYTWCSLVTRPCRITLQLQILGLQGVA